MVKHCRAFFFFNDTATTEIYTLSLHDALPISDPSEPAVTTSRSFGLSRASSIRRPCESTCTRRRVRTSQRSEEHTSELQSLAYLVCRLLLEKKNSASTARDA